jgi:SAM-dependent methyltransferase
VDNPFDAVTSSYGRVRPGYPGAAVDAVEAAAGGAPGGRVAADIGAGTGKMTGALAARGWRVVAVEPSAAMRAQLRASMGLGRTAGAEPAVSVRDATAERTGLGDGSVDLVVYAQSWHWVEPEAAGAEAARILRPGGAIAAVWNQMDVSDPWVLRLTRIMRSGDVHRAGDPPAFGPGFTRPELRVVRWVDTMTVEELLELGTTRSSYLRQDPAGRARMQENLRWYLLEHPGVRSHWAARGPGEPEGPGGLVATAGPAGALIALPYTTLVWTARPVPAYSQG